MWLAGPTSGHAAKTHCFSGFSIGARMTSRLGYTRGMVGEIRVSWRVEPPEGLDMTT